MLDLGSGAGADVLISARRVGAAGRAIGLDMTDEMLALARANAAEAGVENVEFLKGYIEDIPLPDGGGRRRHLQLRHQPRRRQARVLARGRPRAASRAGASPSPTSSPTTAWTTPPAPTWQQWTGCIAGALTEDEFRAALPTRASIDVEIRPTHRVHEHAGSAIIRARKP